MTIYYVVDNDRVRCAPRPLFHLHRPFEVPEDGYVFQDSSLGRRRETAPRMPVRAKDKLQIVDGRLLRNGAAL